MNAALRFLIVAALLAVGCSTQPVESATADQIRTVPDQGGQGPDIHLTVGAVKSMLGGQTATQMGGTLTTADNVRCTSIVNTKPGTWEVTCTVSINMGGRELAVQCKYTYKVETVLMIDATTGDYWYEDQLTTTISDCH